MASPIAAGRHKKKKGAARMIEFGYKQCQVWFDKIEAEQVIFAAKKAGKKLATWVRERAVQAALNEK